MCNTHKDFDMAASPTMRARRSWRSISLALLTFCVTVPAAHADLRADCEEDLLPDVEACSALIRRNPRDAEAFIHRGRAYASDEKYDRALGDFNKAIEISPKNAAYHLERAIFFLGRSLSPIEDFARALADATKAVELEPNSAKAYAARCEAYRKLLDTERAIADCLKALNLEPNDSNAQGELAYARLLPANAASPSGTPQPIGCSVSRNAGIEFTNTLTHDIGTKLIIKWTVTYHNPPKLSSPTRTGVYVTGMVAASGARIGGSAGEHD